MKRIWLLFTQTVTVLLAAYFVVATLKPQWLDRKPRLSSVVPILEAPAPAAEAGDASGTHSFRRAAQVASAAVVSISTSKAPPRNPHQNDPWFRFFFGEQGNSEPQSGLGSGVVVSPAGYVLTNNHVIEEADDIEVMFSDGVVVKATIIGTDPETDLAVLKVPREGLTAITWGDSDALQVGDPVLAVGNPFGVGKTVTSGIVSALGRSQLGINTFENFIQTDAAINPGNSGGALVDMAGNLIGINTAIYSRSGGSMGIGFAIPTSTARTVMTAIVQDGKVTRGWIGVEPRDLSPELAESFGLKQGNGVVITGVLQNGPAAQAGVRPGDLILKVDGHAVSTVPELLSRVAELKPGTPASLLVLRQQGETTLTVVPGRRNPVRPR
ncbi:MAG TPA: trypsin-like peptidase domain-containing protein [Burkholderiaceae bacterium]|nr:trypsin-like peptidase domain-containing protein [Burkholderiaceae bacterium]